MLQRFEVGDGIPSRTITRRSRGCGAIFSDAAFASTPLDLEQLLARRGRDRFGVLVGGGEPRLDAFGDDALRLVDERVDHLGLGDDAHDLALHEQVALPAARGDAEIGLARLTRSVHDAAHDRDLERDVALLRAAPARSDATPMTSTSARPHDGHAIRSRPLRSRRPSASSRVRPAFASSTGSAVSEKRIVSPMPSASNVADAGDRLHEPGGRRARLR